MQKYVAYGLVFLVGFLLLVVIIFAVIYFWRSGEYGKACTVQSDCRSGLVCDDRDRVCRGGLGSVCSTEQACATNLLCTNNVCMRADTPSIRPQPFIPPPRVPFPISVRETLRRSNVDDLSLSSPPRRLYAGRNAEDEEDYFGYKRPGWSLPPWNAMREDSEPTRRTYNWRASPETSFIPAEEFIGDSLTLSVSEPVVNNYVENERGGLLTRQIVQDPAESSVPAPTILSASRLDTAGFSSPVVDACSFFSSVIFLLADGQIVRREGQLDTQVASNIQAFRVTSFRGHLYALGSEAGAVAALYVMDNAELSTGQWQWRLCTWAPTNLYHFSSTLDGKYLWLQDTERGYLYTQAGSLLQQAATTLRRVYGKDNESYLEIDSTAFTARVQPSGYVLSSVADALLTYYGEVAELSVGDSAVYRKLVLINWKPYYLQN